MWCPAYLNTRLPLECEKVASGSCNDRMNTDAKSEAASEPTSATSDDESGCPGCNDVTNYGNLESACSVTVRDDEESWDELGSTSSVTVRGTEESQYEFESASSVTVPDVEESWDEFGSTSSVTVQDVEESWAGFGSTSSVTVLDVEESWGGFGSTSSVAKREDREKYDESEFGRSTTVKEEEALEVEKLCGCVHVTMTGNEKSSQTTRLFAPFDSAIDEQITIAIGILPHGCLPRIAHSTRSEIRSYDRAYILRWLSEPSS
ncbi:uncharacterized protein LMH87_007650 [Akanthomyces muscarius]|uniref:Uncharacterized protein n=1 Tax=Akanthomyces muscarius TaxID=2231603 RepID=A0A9W8URA4_AKAMU|nr:uncharacterized protein LMH87_007650 [Akanthomyces muscarius]KAJ4161621.1 hypothetical protein LMH87_007650 [Akanthomyces muscarius]